MVIAKPTHSHVFTMPYVCSLKLTLFVLMNYDTVFNQVLTYSFVPQNAFLIQDTCKSCKLIQGMSLIFV